MPERTTEADLPLSTSLPDSINNGNNSSGSILVVDDEAGIRESLEVLLSLEGYAVKTAPDGEEGLRQLDQNSFDLVLLDLALPGQSGIELLPQFKEHQPDVPVIMITATLSARALRTSSRSRGTMKSCWPTSALRLRGAAPRKKISSSSAR